MTAVTTPTRSAPSRRAVLASAAGNFIEWYDYAIYTYLAPVIATVFFPSENRTYALLATFAAFGVAFFFRPLGAAVFGWFGDRYGRRNTLIVVVLMMAGATTCIGLLPPASSIGVTAAVLLVLCRVVQGFSGGGEYGGAASLLVEFAPANRRGLYGSLQPATTGLSLAVVSGLGALTSAVLTQEQLETWGWRPLLLIAAPLGLIALYLRLRVEETPRYKYVERQSKQAQAPLREVWKSHKWTLLKALCAIVAWTAGGYATVQYLPTYLSEEVHMSLTAALLASLAGNVLYAVSAPMMGALSDRIGRKPVMIGGAVGLLLFAYPGYLMLGLRSVAVVVLVGALFGLGLGAISGPATAYMAELVPTRVRYTGLALPFALSVAIFGGTAPFVLTWLISLTGSTVFAPGLYMTMLALISTVAVLRSKESAGQPLRD
jgi:MHS family proline/betaine transporter-like MFS transporter